MTTKEIILSTAFKLFAAGNFESVSMSQLEKLTGLSKGAFYHHFKSKEEIFIQAMDLFFFDHEITDSEEISGLDLESWIRYRCNAASRHAKSLKKQYGFDLKAFNVYGLMTTASRHYPDFYQKIKLQQETEVAVWEQKVRAAQSLGTLHSMNDPLVLARLFVVIADGAGVRCDLCGEQAKSESEAIEMCLEFMKRMNSQSAPENPVPAEKKEKEKEKEKETEKEKEKEKEKEGPQMLSLF